MTPDDPINELFGIRGAGTGKTQKKNQKYEMTDEVHPQNRKLRRIRALRDIKTHGIKAGDTGGYIETERNLDQDGDCWVDGSAVVSDGVYVTDNAYVGGFAVVSNAAEVSDDASVAGNARVSGQAVVYGKAQISGKARVSGSAGVRGKARVQDNAVVSGQAVVDGSAVIRGNQNITGKESVMEDIEINEEDIELTPEEEDEIVGSILDTLSDEEEEAAGSLDAGVHRSENDKKDDLENSTVYTKTVHPVLTQEGIKMNNTMVGMLRKAYEPLRGKKIPTKTAIKIRELMSQMKGDVEGLKKIVSADIPFVSRTAGTILLFDHDWDVSDIKKLYKGGKIPGISEDTVRIDGRRREFREKLRKLAYEKCKKAMGKKYQLKDAEVKDDDGDDDEMGLEFEGKVNEASYDKSLGDLKKTLEKEYGSANFKNLKFVKIKQDIVSIQTPSGNELERYQRVSKTGWTSISEDLDESTKDLAEKREEYKPYIDDLADWILANHPQVHKATRYLKPTNQYDAWFTIWKNAGKPNLDEDLLNKYQSYDESLEESIQRVAKLYKGGRKLRDTLTSAVTEYDRKESKKKHYSIYALPQYLARVHDIVKDVEKGATVRSAIIAGFTHPLVNFVLKGVGEPKAEDHETRMGLVYKPVTEETDQEELEEGNKSFALKVEITDKYRELKYGNASKKDWKDLADKARKAGLVMKKEIEKLQKIEPSRFQRSQMDLLDMWIQSVESVMVNSERAARSVKESTSEELEEKRKSKSDYEIYHDSYFSALSEVLDFVRNNGYHVDEDYWFNQVSSGPRKPSPGKTNSFNLELHKNGKDVKNRALSFQVYGLESGRYELTVYIA